MKTNYYLSALFIVSGYFMYKLYEPYLLSILIATLLAISTAKTQNWFYEKTKSNFLSSFLSTLALAILFFAPLGYFLATATIKLHNIDSGFIETTFLQIKSWIISVPDSLGIIKPYLEDFLIDFRLSQVSSFALESASKIGAFSAGFVKNALMILVFYFFVKYYSHTFITYLKKLIYIPKQDFSLLSFELSAVMSVTFYSILVTAVFEGALFGIAVGLMGYNGLMFGILYGFASLIPIIGGALLWIPFAIYESSLSNYSSAIFISLYSIIVISIIADTFIKPMIIKDINQKLIKSEAKINELIIFFAILAGLTSFGFWGMILGPAITSFFLAVLKIVDQHKNDIEVFKG